MIRHTDRFTCRLSLLATILLCGCQRNMGPSASGPFAPAGTLAPTSSQPLIPFGPLTGATRVPPPPTGSTQASNGYAAPTGNAVPSGSPQSNLQPHGIDSGNYDAFAQRSNPQLTSTRRSLPGGMPVIDLTSGPSSSSQTLNQPAIASNQPVGSGVINPQWQAGGMTSAPNISVPQGDLAARLRPLDPALESTGVPVPGQVAPSGFAAIAGIPSTTMPSGVAMTQYRSEADVPSPAWEAVQPASANVAAQSPQYVSQSPTATFPSTEPVNPAARTASSQNDSLLWRNPSAPH